MGTENYLDMEGCRFDNRITHASFTSAGVLSYVRAQQLLGAASEVLECRPQEQAERAEV